MTARSHERGHPIIAIEGVWFYEDTGEKLEGNPRPCALCKCHPTKDGHDACLGQLSDVKSACCGHGVEPGYIIHNDGSLDMIVVRTREEHQKVVDWEKEVYGYSWHEQFS